MNQQLLRLQNNLVISGMGVIMLGVWAVVRAVLYSLLHMDEFLALVPESVPRVLAIFTTYAMIAVILAIVLLVRFYIGRSAMAEGRGGHRKSFYLVLAGILAVMNTTDFFRILFTLTQTEKSIPEEIAILVVDLTLIFTLIDLIASAIQIRKMTAVPGKGEEACS